MRRTSSEKEESAAQNPARGLFGRKTSGSQVQSQSQTQVQARDSSQNQQQSQSQVHREQVAQEANETLIMATPSKPRFFDPAGRYRSEQYDHHYGPTPIAEEPRSERPIRVAETPVAPRIAHTLFGRKRQVAPMGVAQDALLGSPGDGEGDPFGDLMVPTDDEEDGDVRGPTWTGVPETPAR